MGVPRDHDEAARKNRAGQRSLDEVHEQKKRAAERDPQIDRSRENADKAAREWKGKK